MIWNGKIAWQQQARTVRLRNISASGVLIDSPFDFPEGTDLTLDLGKSGQFEATVGWSRGGQAGLVFKSPFELSALAAARPEVAPQSWKRPGLPRPLRRPVLAVGERLGPQRAGRPSRRPRGLPQILGQH